MKSDRLQDALGEIRDDFILDANFPLQKRSDRLKRASLAACCCILLGAVFSFPILQKPTEETLSDGTPSELCEAVPTEAETQAGTVTPDGQIYFIGILLDIQPDSALVRCLDSDCGDITPRSQVQISLNTLSSDSVPTILPGDYIRVIYTAESFPDSCSTEDSEAAILCNPVSIFLLDNSDVLQSGLCQAIMVDDVLYYNTWITNNVPRCGMMDGTITATCPNYQLPSENNQSNFGAGYGYQYGAEGTIEIQMEDGNWYIFAAFTR